LAETIPQLKQYPEFSRIFDLVASQNPLQRKRIESFLRRQSEEYWIFAEGLSGTLNKALLQSENIRTEAARSYNRMCMDILREQIRFRKTGVYLISEAEAANQNVYSQPEVMRYYIVGLLLSYLFWPNHYQMWHFFTDHLSLMPAMANCLEVGAGHGLFTAETLRRFPGLEIHVLDISETSLNLSREMLTTFKVDPNLVRFQLGDYLKTPLDGKFDFIIMGEVLEHVNDAPDFMRHTRQLIQPGGSVYLSTCVNCPAVDHVYHFHTVEEIRVLLRTAGFSISHELALPAEAVSEAMWEEELVTINYCAILTPLDSLS
jgi:2-polyprenyl-3-methyl-5-hydroxy-6-metoxy-1,4-benzoquinol methylase